MNVMDPHRADEFACGTHPKLPPGELARFWCWLADHLHDAPEFSDLSDANKATLAMLLRAGPTR